MRFTALLILFFILSLRVFSQEYAVVFGRITDENNQPLELVNVSVMTYNIGTVSDSKGNYELQVPANRELLITFSSVGYKTRNFLYRFKAGVRVEVNEKLDVFIHGFNPIIIEEKNERLSNITRIDPKTVQYLPGPSGGVESMLKTMGASSNNELSTQYSVRGGNFDENLVYVNDIEIYRPFLVRSGQQEGLSFINPDMVSSIQFSAGGFDAKYGDKMSSVLDIRYKKPTEYGATIKASLLGAAVHLEGCTKNHRLTHISGFRYKTNQYVLNSLDVKGDYKPSFTDFQTYITYDINEKLEINFLGNYASNRYLFVPDSQMTAFGDINTPLGVKIYFDGHELDNFATMMGALSTDYRPKKDMLLKFIASAYNTSEKETYDIQGQYFLNELDKELGSDNVGDSLMNIGVGTFLNHARNYLDVYVVSLAHKGKLIKKKNEMQWGIKYDHDIVFDDITEWRMLDSAGYSLPYTDSIVSVSDYLKTDISLITNRFSGFAQNTYSLDIDSALLGFTLGARLNYWDLSNQLLFSPRTSLAYKPHWKRDFLFRLAAGVYYQPPFYKELRNMKGEINKDIKAQMSVHFVLGSDYYFTAWKRKSPFKFSSEIYYKYLDNLIPYEVDNVRVRYYATNNAHGYAAGIDMKISGEFVKGVDSWANLSFMQTEEDIKDDFYYAPEDTAYLTRIEPGYIPRPSDQRVNFGLFFQDYLPKNPTYTVQLSLLFGTGLPFGPPDAEKYKATLRMPPYRRVDIGFSKVIKSEGKELSATNPLRFFKSLWITAEVFNLLGTKNTISYMWIADIGSRYYAVPNYLTARRFNIELVAKF